MEAEMLSRSPDPLQLHDGSRIAVIGGGPAGSFFALHALDLARQRGLRIQVFIFEGKDFSQRGPKSCNKCAGILSSHLVHNLHSLQLRFPPQVIMGEIRSYVLHLGEGMVEINQPDPERRIVSVYRGTGPRLGDLPPGVSFDAWILSEALNRGAELIRERVTAVTGDERPAVATRSTALTCDLVVLATGVNSRLPHLPDLGYERPATEVMSQDELAVSEMSGNHRVHIFTGRPAGVIFAGLVPKGPYVNVSLLGHKLAKDSVGKLLEMNQVRRMLRADPRRLCGCNPRIAVSMAQNYYADRFVAVGDAAVTRLYKDGIGSAFLTARQAARVAVGVGTSERAFRQGYAAFCESISRDNRIGRMLFAIWDRTQRSRVGTRAWYSALTAEEGLPVERQHCRMALWGMFTGDDSYRAIAQQLLHPGVQAKLLAGFLRAGLWTR
jgi:flavin-dependent dehydrogenase